MFQTMYGHMVITHDVEVNHISYDSRTVSRGDLFVAIRGTGVDGHKFVDRAIANGASVVVLEDESQLPDSLFMHAGVIKVVVENSREALAKLAGNFYNHPSSRMTVVGITGTNGKTTTSHLVRSVLEAEGSRAGLIGTIEYVIGDEHVPASHTTPESLELQKIMATMLERNCASVAMEVSSHAIDQHRIAGIAFNVAVFTNLTQDHLDYHGTMEQYFTAKAGLFTPLTPEQAAVINVDDPYGERLTGMTRGNVITYAINRDASVRAASIERLASGTRIDIVHGNEHTVIATRFIGMFNVSNTLAAFATGIALDLQKDAIRAALERVPPVRGRFEPVMSPTGWMAIIDYAHTPDALEKTLTAVRSLVDAKQGQRVITVFGCGGNRDATKRPRMGAIAASMSDLTFITSDNPRNEQPEAIISDIVAGVPTGTTYRVEADRAAAITAALSEARRGDVVLIAGKGHEDYQIIGDRKLHFSDREVVEQFLRQRQ